MRISALLGLKAAVIPSDIPAPSPRFQELIKPGRLAEHSPLVGWGIVAGLFSIPLVRTCVRILRKTGAVSDKEGGFLHKASGWFEYYAGLLRDGIAILGAGVAAYLQYKGIGPVKLHCYHAEAIVAGALGVYDFVYQVRVRRQVNRLGQDLTKSERRLAKVQALGILGRDVKDVLPKKE
jgi:hypothetical protein